jgi:hypothetical protein
MAHTQHPDSKGGSQDLSAVPRDSPSCPGGDTEAIRMSEYLRTRASSLRPERICQPKDTQHMRTELMFRLLGSSRL